MFKRLFSQKKIIGFLNLPDHDILIAVITYQTFSIFGVSKNKVIGKSNGFIESIEGSHSSKCICVSEDLWPRVKHGQGVS